MESSVLKQMEHVRRSLTGDPGCPVLGDSPAELKEDLYQAKTRIGMTESLLNALSPCDSLEIFSKLEVSIYFHADFLILRLLISVSLKVRERQS